MLKQEFSDGLQISMNIKSVLTSFDNSLLFTEHSEHYRLSTLNHNVRFLPCQHREDWHNAIRVRAKPHVHHLIIPGHSRREVPRQGCGHS